MPPPPSSDERYGWDASLRAELADLERLLGR